MFSKVFWHGLFAGMLAALAAIIYRRIYYFATEVDFSQVLSIERITGLCILFSMLAAILNYGLIRLLKKKGELVFNFMLSITSFVCLMIPISISLPLNIKLPELFPGLAVPIVFFPAIAWYTLNPLFKKGI